MVELEGPENLKSFCNFVFCASMQLRNLVDRRVLQERLMNESFKRTTISFYRYVDIERPEELRNQLWKNWSELNVFGRVYLAHEGINAQISVPEHNTESFRQMIDESEYFAQVPFKIAVEDDGKSFWKLTIKVREKLVADGLNDNAFDTTNVGTHLTAEEFNKLLAQDDSVCIDMRNRYESRIGYFDGAVCPRAQTFRDELPEALEILKEKNHDPEKPVLLYCTGGIRCEKASAFLRHNGYRNVGQLHGGIIDYAHQIKRKKLPNKFKGKNYVFDGRGAETISQDVLSECDLCQSPCDTYINCANVACNELFLSCSDCQKKLNQCCSEECMHIASLPEEEQKTLRRGKKTTKRIRPSECGFEM